MDDILKRLGNVEVSVSELKSQVSSILGVIPHLATKSIEAIIPQLATKADVASIETAVIKWIIATTLATASLAFAIAKFVH